MHAAAWRTYLELIRLRFLSLLAYRLYLYSGVATYLLYIGGYYFFWMAVYGGREELAGLTPAQMATYLAVGWLARACYFNNLDEEIAQEVRDGTVAVQLVRPVPYLGQKLAGAVGEALFRLLFFSLPGLALAILLFPVQLPAGADRWLPYGLALLLAFAINAELNVLTGILAVFWVRIQGVQWARKHVIDLLSGLYLPLPLFPAPLAAVLAWLPFPLIGYVPSGILSGGMAPAETWGWLARGALWALALGWAVAWAWRGVRRHLVVHGG